METGWKPDATSTILQSAGGMLARGDFCPESHARQHFPPRHACSRTRPPLSRRVSHAGRSLHTGARLCRVPPMAVEVLYGHPEDTMAVHFNHEAPVARETFVRGQETIVVECLGAEIILEFSGAPAESFRFQDPVDMVFSKNDLEREFQRSGWTLAEYESVRQPAQSSTAAALGPLGRAH